MDNATLLILYLMCFIYPIFKAYKDYKSGELDHHEIFPIAVWCMIGGVVWVNTLKFISNV